MESSNRPLRIALIAGETSGDQLGGDLIKALRKQQPHCEFAGVGGPRMQAAGMTLWSDYSPLAVMGLFEVLRHLRRLLRFRRQLVDRLRDWQPDILVGIDAPDFNLGVEKRLKKTGVVTVHYVSPSVWAWREKRAQTIGNSADRVLCLFPMEPPVYARHDVDARFVGHPMADRFPDTPDRRAAREHLMLPTDGTTLALLPGSRLGEIRRLLPTFAEVASELLQRPGLHVVIPAANAAARRAIEALLAERSQDAVLATAIQQGRLRVVDGQADRVLEAADAVLLASGTAALEAALAKCPMVVAYRVAPSTYTLVRALGLLRIQRYSLPNVLHGGALVPEFIQHDCTAAAIVPALTELLDSKQAREAQLAGFSRIHQALRIPGGAAEAAATAVLELLPAVGTQTPSNTEPSGR